MIKRLLTLSVLGHAAWAAPTSDTSSTIDSSPYPVPSFADYAPVFVDCPTNQKWIRPASDGVSPQEAAWVAGRQVKVLDGLTSYLTTLDLTDFDVAEYTKRLKQNCSNVPIMGLSISGGGWASALTGTGALRAFDARYAPAVQQKTGGLLQSMTYLSALSGGSWPVMSLATNNFPGIDEMVASWFLNIDRSTAKAPGPHATTFEAMFKEIYPKFAEGFHLSFMDLLGRTFGYEYLPGPTGGMGVSLSNVQYLSNFQNHEMPFPMWQAGSGSEDDVKIFGIEVPYYNSTIYEFNPLEFGAWNGPEAFFPMKYLGTSMKDGQPGKACVIGFDRASFILGVVADAINYWIIQDKSNGALGDFSKRSVGKTERRTFKDETPPALIKGLEQGFNETFNYTLDDALYATVPNPFFKSSDNEALANITLLDESEMLQSLPLWTQAQPARKSDFIVAWDDDGGDTKKYSWNNGTNLWGSYLYAKENGVPFPIVPPSATFVNKNFTHKPVFFGCNANLTTTNDLRSPIILYLANSPYSAYTNFTWNAMAFSNEQMAVIMTNSWNIVTQGNGTLDTEWPECLACAAIDRSLTKVGMERSAQCERCLQQYCWDGSVDNSSPPVLDLSLVLDPTLSFPEWNKSVTAEFWPEIPAS